jgi:hypothetical protein
MRYIYYEMWNLAEDGINMSDPEMRNENVLLLRPKTPPSGYLCLRSVSEIGVGGIVSIQRNWVDIDKYLANSGELPPNIQAVVSLLRSRMRDENIGRTLG